MIYSLLKCYDLATVKEIHAMDNVALRASGIFMSLGERNGC